LHALLVGDADVGQDTSHIDALLRELPGATKKSTPDELAALLGKWVVTLSGPGANVFWKLDHGEKGPLPAAHHGFAVCLNCVQFSTSGCCPHTYAAGIAKGRDLSFTVFVVTYSFQVVRFATI